MIEEQLRAGYDAFNRGDFDAVLALFHPDVELHRPGGLAPVVGIDEFREWMKPDAFAEQRFEPVSVEVGDGQLLIHLRMSALAAGSGIELEVDTWSVMTYDEDSLITRVDAFMFHEEAAARAAAGLD